MTQIIVRLTDVTIGGVKVALYESKDERGTLYAVTKTRVHVEVGPHAVHTMTDKGKAWSAYQTYVDELRA